MTFKTGDVVVLKSGGPDMTVSGPTPGSPGYLSCQWFGGRKLENGRFPVASLIAAPKDKDKK